MPTKQVLPVINIPDWKQRVGLYYIINGTLFRIRTNTNSNKQIVGEKVTIYPMRKIPPGIYCVKNGTLHTVFKKKKMKVHFAEKLDIRI